MKLNLPAAIMLGLAIAPGLHAHIWFDNSAGTLDFGTATNWNTNVLPSTGGTENAFIGASGGVGGTPYAVTYGGTLTTVGELQVGTESNAFGAIGNPGGMASLTLNSSAALTVAGNLIIGQGRDNVTDNSGTITVNTGATLTVNGSRIFLGFFDNDESGATKGVLTVNGGTVNQNSPGKLLIIGGWDANNGENYGRGVLNLNSGTVNFWDVNLGRQGGNGTVTQTGGAFNVAGYMSMGMGFDSRHGVGTYTITGGTLTVAQDFSVHEAGNLGTTVSSVNQSGGTVTLNGATKIIGRAATGGGQGIYNLSGGALDIGAAGDLQVGGGNTGARGELNISGTSQLSISGTVALAVARTGNSTGTVNQNGGTVSLSSTSTNGVWLGSGGAGSNATYHLNGGTLTVPKITPDAGTGTKAFNFSGGTLKANGNFTVATATNFTTTINTGGAVINTNGFDVAWQPALLAGSGSGGLTKLGGGTVTLAGANTYAGTTTVAAGNLNVGHANALGTTAGNTIIQSGAMLSLYGLAGGSTLAEPLNLAGTGIAGAGAIRQGGGKSNTLSGTITLSGDTLIGSDGGAAINFTDPAGISGTNTNLTIHNDGGSNIYITGPLAIGTGGFTKVGNGNVTLYGGSSYTGTTNVTAGKLTLGSGGSIATSTAINLAVGSTLDVAAVSGGWTVAAGQTLKGQGTVTGSTTIVGIHAPGNSPGIQSFSSNLSYAATSLFAWDLTSGTAGTRGTNYDGVDVAGDLSGGDAIFRVILGSGAFSDAGFWDNAQSWSDIFNVNGAQPGLQTVFANVQWFEGNTNMTSATGTQGYFSLNGNSLSWSPVPEPSGAILAGLLALLSMSHRQRHPQK
jgi:autotransporter-associated beta strand protein